jgi:predicted hydrocarbon binding protein
MCAVAKGIVRGVAKHHGESVTITEAECMLTGGKECRLAVRLIR